MEKQVLFLLEVPRVDGFINYRKALIWKKVILIFDIEFSNILASLFSVHKMKVRPFAPTRAKHHQNEFISIELGRHTALHCTI